MPNSLAALDLRGLMFPSGRLEGSKGLTLEERDICIFQRQKSHIFVPRQKCICSLLNLQVGAEGKEKASFCLL